MLFTSFVVIVAFNYVTCRMFAEVPGFAYFWTPYLSSSLIGLIKFLLSVLIYLNTGTGEVLKKWGSSRWACPMGTGVNGKVLKSLNLLSWECGTIIDSTG